MKNEVIIQFLNVSKRFGNFYAVRDIDLTIHRGEVVGFLGPNGAGKSTTMKMLANLLRPSEGEIWIRGNGQLEKLTNATKDHLLDHIGFLVENPAFYDMSPRDVLTYFGKLKGYDRSKLKARVEEIVAMVGLTDWIDKNIATFSKGMRQKIGIISAIVHDPNVIVLDEPHTGLDPKARREVRDFILQLKAMGKTIFLSSHLLYEVSEVADRVAIISNGKIIACDTLDALEAQAKKSVIRVEVLQPPTDNGQALIDKFQDLLKPHTGMDGQGNDFIHYFPDTHVFEILFDGDSANQRKILQVLIGAGIEVIDFSVPKAGLLEDLYLDFIDKEDAAQQVPTITEA